MLGPIGRFWRRKVDAWIDHHHPRRQGSYAINRRRIYILPSRPGWGFATVTLIVLLAAMNYSNSMAFQLAFWLGALGFVVMHETHANLLDLHVRLGPPEPVFVGESAYQPVILSNAARRPRVALCLSLDREPPAQALVQDCSDETQAHLRWTPTHRGLHQPPRFAISTNWPLGLFRAWSLIHLQMPQLVYPAPAPPGLPPPSRGVDPEGREGLVRGQEELVGLREYVQGDSPRHIHWRTLASHDQLASRNFADPLAEATWLDLEQVRHKGGLEEQLAQLCRWILDLHGARQAFGLRLGGREIPIGTGDAHRDRCLEALALYGQN